MFLFYFFIRSFTIFRQTMLQFIYILDVPALPDVFYHALCSLDYYAVTIFWANLWYSRISHRKILNKFDRITFGLFSNLISLHRMYWCILIVLWVWIYIIIDFINYVSLFIEVYKRIWNYILCFDTKVANNTLIFK